MTIVTRVTIPLLLVRESTVNGSLPLPSCTLPCNGTGAVAGLNVPVGHAAHELTPPSDTCPSSLASHVQSLALTLPVDSVPVLAVQSEHAAAEGLVALYVSAAQATMLLPEPVKPATATQSLSATPPAVLCEFAGQSVQSSPTKLLNFPAAHALQVESGAVMMHGGGLLSQLLSAVIMGPTQQPVPAEAQPLPPH